MNAQGVERFNDGVQALLLSQPFFGTLLMKMPHKVDEAIPTLCTNGSEIRYNPDFMAQQDTSQAMFCVAHEVLHAAWMHLDRLRHYLTCGVGPDGKPLDTRRFNMALDYPLNASLVASGVGTVPAGIKICYDPGRFSADMTPEEVYCLLADEGGGGNGKGEALDTHEPSTGDASQTITAADVQQAANVCKAMRGKLPAGIDRLLGAIQRPSVSPWRRLRQFVTSALSGHDATTWRRLQRRMVARGVGMPGRTKNGAGRVGIVGDTSGSIGQEMLDLFGGHMAAIMDDARPQEVRVYWTDAKVHRVDTAKTPTDLRRILSSKIPGGGGTNMPRGVNAALDDGCDCVVVLTDGYTPFGEPSPKPVIWAITTPGKRSPHGETIHIS